MSAQNLEDAYELSPLQQYMLFNTLCKPGSGLYVEQSVYALQGALNVSAFERAWQRLADRHAVFRTAFFWEELDKPLQVVLRQVPLPLDKQDWRNLSSSEQEARLDAYLETDRRRGFMMSEAPLLRLALIQTAEDTYYFIRNFHHLLLDRWSLSLVLKEVFALYEAFRQGRDLRLPVSRPYRNYITWLQQRDVTEAEAFWRRNLEGFTAPITLASDHDQRVGGGMRDHYGVQQARLSGSMTAALRSWARQNHLTLNTLVHGAWALLVSRASGTEDVLFGATFSGRSPVLADIESMVGLFMNTLPVRVQVSPYARLLPWLQGLQDQMAELAQYEYSPLADVLRWSDVSGGQLLFESILIFENIPLDIASLGRGGELQIRQVRSSGGRTDYPLTVVIVPGPELSLRIIYDCHCFDAPAIDRLLRDFQTLLEAIGNHPRESLLEFLRLLDLESTECRSNDRHAHHTVQLVPQGKTDRGEPADMALQRRNPIRASVAPRNSVERRLLETWQEVLGIEPISVNDNLFDLGVHSLQAMRLFAEIERRFGQSLPLTSIFKAPTIEHQASLMDGPAPLNGSPSLIAIQPRGSKPPFFCVHELFGDVLCYVHLARHLGEDRPFYALPARGLDGEDEPFTDIESMAAHYVKAIQTVQAKGPYALGGLCLGGVVAFEMAQQLHLKGEAVSLVALLDSGVNSNLGTGDWWRNFFCNLPGNLPSWLIGSLQLNRAQWATLIRQKVRMTRAALGDAFRSSRDGSHRDEVPLRVRELGDLFQFTQQHRKVAQVQYHAFRQYTPRVYPGRLTLFRARMQPFFSSHAPDKGWGRLAGGGLEIKVVPGNHLGMLQEPHVEVLAEQLRACLDGALRK